jgi:hypothetical protein
MNTTKQKYNIVTVKTVNEKDYYTRIGVAFPLEKGGFNILFDALPTNGRALIVPERIRCPRLSCGAPRIFSPRPSRTPC